jgi:hypothetical protein
MVIWLRRNAERLGIITGAACVLIGVYQALGPDMAMIVGGLLLLAGSLRRAPK